MSNVGKRVIAGILSAALVASSFVGHVGDAFAAQAKDAAPKGIYAGRDINLALKHLSGAEAESTSDKDDRIQAIALADEVPEGVFAVDLAYGGEVKAWYRTAEELRLADEEKGDAGAEADADAQGAASVEAESAEGLGIKDGVSEAEGEAAATLDEAVRFFSPLLALGQAPFWAESLLPAASDKDDSEEAAATESSWRQIAQSVRDAVQEAMDAKGGALAEEPEYRNTVFVHADGIMEMPKDASHMFEGLTALEEIPALEGMDFSKTENFDEMFSGCAKLADFSAVERMRMDAASSLQGMFRGCTLLDDRANLNPHEVAAARAADAKDEAEGVSWETDSNADAEADRETAPEDASGHEENGSAESPVETSGVSGNSETSGAAVPDGDAADSVATESEAAETVTEPSDDGEEAEDGEEKLTYMAWDVPEGAATEAAFEGTAVTEYPFWYGKENADASDADASDMDASHAGSGDAAAERPSATPASAAAPTMTPMPEATDAPGADAKDAGREDAAETSETSETPETPEASGSPQQELNAGFAVTEGQMAEIREGIDAIERAEGATPGKLIGGEAKAVTPDELLARREELRAESVLPDAGKPAWVKITGYKAELPWTPGGVASYGEGWGTHAFLVVDSENRDQEPYVAICMAPNKSAPANNVQYSADVRTSKNETLMKVLYYGYGGLSGNDVALSSYRANHGGGGSVADSLIITHTAMSKLFKDLYPASYAASGAQWDFMLGNTTYVQDTANFMEEISRLDPPPAGSEAVILWANYDTNMQYLAYLKVPDEPSRVSVKKASSKPDITDDPEADYSLKATFQICASNQFDRQTTHTVYTIQTDKNGNSSTITVPQGTYYIRETESGKNMKPADPTDVKTFTVASGETYQETRFKNEPWPHGRVVVYKRDEHGDPIDPRASMFSDVSGEAVFWLYLKKKDGTWEKADVLAYDESLKAYVSKVVYADSNHPSGDFKVVEKQAPTYYQADGSFMGTLSSLKKTDKVKGHQFTYSRTVNNYHLYEIELPKTDKDGRELRGCTFNVYEYDPATGQRDKLVGTMTEHVRSKNDTSRYVYYFGQLRVTKENEGKFYVKEVDAPSGYKAEYDKKFRITSSTSVEKPLLLEAFADPAVNEPKPAYGTITVRKYDKEGSGRKKLSGATFKVYMWDRATQKYSDKAADTLVEEPAGSGVYKSTKDLPIRADASKFDQLNDGKFRVVETEGVPGYVNGLLIVDGDGNKVVDKRWQEDVQFSASAAPGSVINKTVDAINTENSYTIEKLDWDGDPMLVKFTVYPPADCKVYYNGVLTTLRAEGTELWTGYVSETQANERKNTPYQGAYIGNRRNYDAGYAGKIVLEGMPAVGSWRYKEVQVFGEGTVPSMTFTPLDKEYTFTVNKDYSVGKSHLVAAEKTVRNAPKAPLRVVKKDDKGRTSDAWTGFPAGTKFTVHQRLSDGSYTRTVYATLVWSAEKGEFVDEETGELAVLEYTEKNGGMFRVKETESTPGYRLAPDYQYVTVPASGIAGNGNPVLGPGETSTYKKPLTVTFTDEPNEHSIKKVGSDGVTAVHAKFTLRNLSATGPQKLYVNGKPVTLAADGTVTQGSNTMTGFWTPLDGSNDATKDYWKASGVPSGQLRLTHLAPGKYEYRETEVDAPYVPSDEIFHFTVKKDGTVLVGGTETALTVITNERAYPLEITKTGENGITSDPGSGFPEGTKFTVQKYDGEADRYVDDAVLEWDGTRFVNPKTGARYGMSVSEGQAANFRIRESASTPGYARDKNTYDIAIAASGSWTVKNHGTNETVASGSGTTVDVAFPNEPNRYTIEKISGTETQAALPSSQRKRLDATFRFTPLESEAKLRVNGSWQTIGLAGADLRTGTGTAQKGFLVIEKIPDGMYTYKETAVEDGWTPVGTLFTIRVKDGEIADITENAYSDDYQATRTHILPNQASLKLLVNKLSTNDASQDANGNGAKPASFPLGTEITVYEYTGTAGGQDQYNKVYAKLTWNAAAGKFTEDGAQGYMRLAYTDANQGKFKVKETKAADGYIRSSEERLIRVNADGTSSPAASTVGGEKVVQVSFSNAPNHLSIRKVDAATGAVRAGAQFVMQRNGGSTSASASNADRRVLTTASPDGTATAWRLAPGDWTYYETVAPPGCDKDSGRYHFAVLEDGTIDPSSVTPEGAYITSLLTVAFPNYSGVDLKITKKDDKGALFDAKTGFPSGTEFGVYEWDEESGAYKDELYKKIVYIDDWEQAQLPGAGAGDGAGALRSVSYAPKDNEYVVEFDLGWQPEDSSYYTMQGRVGPQFVDDETGGSVKSRYWKTGQPYMVTYPERPGYVFQGWWVTNMATGQTHLHGGKSVADEAPTLCNSETGSRMKTGSRYFQDLTRPGETPVRFSARWKEEASVARYTVVIDKNDNWDTQLNQSVNSTQITKTYVRGFGTGSEYATKISVEEPKLSGYTFLGWAITGLQDFDDTGSSGINTADLPHVIGARQLAFRGTALPSSFNTVTDVRDRNHTPYVVTTSNVFWNLGAPGTNVVLKAIWGSAGYKVKYHLRGGQETQENPTRAIGDDPFFVAPPTRDGYDFAGWAIWNNASGTSSHTNLHLRSAAYYAAGEAGAAPASGAWTSFANAENGTVGGRECVLVPGTGGMWFKGLRPSDTETQTYVVHPTARWTAKTGNISYRLDGGTMWGLETTPDSFPTSYTMDSPQAIPAPTKPGYLFQGWECAAFEDGIEYQPTIGETWLGDVTLQAVWKAEGIWVDAESVGEPQIPHLTETAGNKGKFMVKELAATEGYILDETVRYVTVDDAVDGVIGAEFVNLPNSFDLTKIWAHDGQRYALDGAEFDIWREEDGEAVETIPAIDSVTKTQQVTDPATGVSRTVEGRVHLERLHSGTWRYMEVEAPPLPDSYIEDHPDAELAVDATIHTFTVDARTHRVTGGGDVELEDLLITDQPFSILKTDQDGNPMPDIDFVITKQGGGYSATKRTDSAGMIRLVGLSAGTYYYREDTNGEHNRALAKAKGFALSPQTNTFVINADGSPWGASVAVYENRLNALTVHKQNTDGIALEGATFTIESAASFDGSSLGADGKYRMVADTMDDGTIAVKGLADGAYTVTETTPPTGYFLDPDPQTFTVSGGAFTILNGSTLSPARADISLTFTDRKASFSIVKSDGLGNPVPGARFTVTRNDGTEAERTVTVGADGTAVVDGLRRGKYTVTETHVPDGYVIDSNNVRSVTVTADGASPSALEYVNRPNRLSIIKTDEAGNELAGAGFKLTRHATQAKAESDEDALEKAVSTGTTGDDGVAPFYGQIRIYGDGDVRVVGEKSAANGIQLKIRKTDVAGQPVAGATFALLHYPAGFTYTTATTDADGTATLSFSSNGTFTVKETTAGVSPAPANIRVTETGIEAIGETPANVAVYPGGEHFYALADGWWRVTETKRPSGYGGPTYRVLEVKDGKIEGGESYEFRHTNYGMNSPQLVKRSADGLLLSGVGFTVWPASMSLEDATQIHATHAYWTDATGHVSIPADDLNPAVSAYSVKETSAPFGYRVDSTVRTLERRVDAETGAVSYMERKVANGAVTYSDTLEFVNEPIYFTIRKTAADGATRLNGAVFRFSYFYYTDHIKDFEVAENGEVRFPLRDIGFPAGRSGILSEYKAPEGYQRSTKTYTISKEYQGNVQVVRVTSSEGESFIIDPNSAETEFVFPFEDEPITFQIAKRDAATNAALDGATFLIAGPSLPAAGVTRTTQNGAGALVDGLVAGTYFVTETGAPLGYRLPDGEDRTQEVEITGEETDPAVVTFEDAKASFRIEKLDKDTELPIAGARFGLFNTPAAPGTPESQALAAFDVPAAGRTITMFGANGAAYPAGDYRLLETVRPANYKDSETWMDFHYDGHGNITVTAVKGGISYDAETFTFTAINEQEEFGDVYIVKKDAESGNELSGATFAIYRKSGTRTLPGGATEDVFDMSHPLTPTWNAAEQRYELKDVPLTDDNSRKVRVVETAPPDGYRLEKQGGGGFVQGADGKQYPYLDGTFSDGVVEFEFTDSPTKLDIKKKDDQGRVLVGASFLYWKDGAQPSTAKEAETVNGVATIGPLTNGTWHYQEGDLPTGYYQDDVFVHMEYVRDDTVHTVEVVDGLCYVDGSAAPATVAEEEYGKANPEQEFVNIPDKRGTLIVEKAGEDGELLEGVIIAAYPYSDSRGSYMDKASLVSHGVAEATAEGLAKEARIPLLFNRETGLYEARLDYTTDNGGRYAVIEEGYGGVSDVSVSDRYTVSMTENEGSVTIRVTDSEDGTDAALSVFPYSASSGRYAGTPTAMQYSAEDGCYAATVQRTTNNQGRFLIEDASGNAIGVAAQYTKGAAGYVLDGGRKTVTITPDGTERLTGADRFVNVKNAVRFRKTDMEGNPLSGAVFHVVKDAVKEGTLSDAANFSEMNTESTGADGYTPYIRRLPAGRYTVTEKKAPATYAVRTNDKWHFVVGDDGRVAECDENGAPLDKDGDGETDDEYSKSMDIAIANEKLEVRIRKFDTRTKAAVPGVKFRITRPNGTTFERTTGADGLIRLTDLTEGEWRYLEIEDANHRNVESKNLGGTFTVGASGSCEKYAEIHNPLTVEQPNGEDVTGGKVTVQKIDSKTKEPLSGAVFHVYEWNPKLREDPAHPGQYLGGYCNLPAPNTTTTPYTMLREIPGRPGFYTNSDRDLVATESNKGKFLVVETKAPTDRYGNTYCAFGEREIDSLFDKLTWEFLYPDDAMENTPTAVKIVKKDEEGTVLPDIVFTIWEKGNESGKRERTTDANGEIVLGHDDPLNADASKAIPIKAGKTYCFQETYIPRNKGAEYQHLHLDPTVHEFTVDALGRVDANSTATYTVINYWNWLITGGEGRTRWILCAACGLAGLTAAAAMWRRKRRKAKAEVR